MKRASPMQDSSAKELKGHGILAVERFRDDTRFMIEFVVRREDSSYGECGDEIRLFLNEQDYRNALERQKVHEIKIKKYARVIEGHILFDGRNCHKPIVV